MTDRHESRATTHADDCWSWGPGHYDCAIREVKRLRGALEECHALSVERWRRLLAAEARAERLAEALRDVMPFVVTDVLEHCDGNKCREQWCAGCSGDAEAAEAVARSAKAAGVAYALLREQEADRE